MSKRAITKKQQVYLKLRDEIVEGKYKPNERLIITKLADQFGVSQIPVREALQQLTSDGYINFSPHTGAMVKSISLTELKEIFEIRITLEALATELAINHLSDSNIEEIKEVIEKSESADLETYPDYNRLFHEKIYYFANNRHLLDIISDLWDNSNRYPKLFKNNNDIETSIKEHRDILNAIKKRNAPLAKQLMIDHKMTAYNKIVQMIKEDKTIKQE